MSYTGGVFVRSGELIEQRPWSQQELDRAIRLRRAGRGATFIGRELRRSRNSVIGALHRAKEPGFLVNQAGESTGRWSLTDRPAHAIPMRFSEQANG